MNFDTVFTDIITERLEVALKAGPVKVKKDMFNPGFNPSTEDMKEAEKILVDFFKSRGSISFVNDREWELIDLRRHYNEDTFSFKYITKGGSMVEVPRWEGSELTKTIKQFKTPKEAIASIPADPNLAYRGMSMAEWAEIKRTKTVRSKGEYNLGTTQEGYTFFGSTPSTAEYYATGFTPFDKNPSRRNPAVVIAVPKAKLQNASEIKIDGTPVGNDEEWIARSIPYQDIAGAWILTPVKSDHGHIDLIVKDNGRVVDGSRSPEGNIYSILKVK